MVYGATAPAGPLAARGDASAAALAATLAKKLSDEVSRCSYAIYLYHGFFVDRETFGPENTAARALLVFSTTFAIAELLSAALKPDVSATFFGISPPRSRLGRTTKLQSA